MNISKPLLVIAVALSAPLTGRADYIFTWHFIYPQLQKFQGSFELTDAEMQPAASFGSDLFHNSIFITSPEGITYHGDDPFGTTAAALLHRILNF